MWVCSCSYVCRMCLRECANTRRGTYVCQTSDKDEGPRRVWPGQLEPDLAYLAEACCHVHRRGAVFGLMHRLELLTKHKKTNMQLVTCIVHSA